jgi:hypothetical protein
MIVYFSCHGCAAVYSAVQERSAAPVISSGLFNCLCCGKPVHHWAEIYSFTDWKCVEHVGDGKELVALHSDFDKLGPAVRLAPAGISDQRGPRCSEASLAAV